MPETPQEKALASEISCALNRRFENVIVEAIVIPELELRNVEWQVFGANLVERTNDPSLENAPKAFNRFGYAPRRQRIGALHGQPWHGDNPCRGPCSQPIDPCRAS
jgi:hypothetical protein